MTEKPRKRRHGDRRDGIWLRDLDPMHGFTPYLYPNRADNEAFIEETIDLTNMNRYIAEKNAQNPEYRYKYFQIILAAIVKTVTLKPRMNRFIAGNRVYQRTELTSAFVVKKQFNEQSEEALAFLKFVPDSTLESIRAQIYKEITTFRKEAAPLIRYRTRDISRIIPGECPCGSPFPRLDRIVGRSDDMIKVKGTNIYPAQVEEILKRIDGFSSEYRIVLENEDLRDRMIVQAEMKDGCNPEALAESLVRECKSGIGIRIVPQVMKLGELPRSEKKTQRVIDNRY